MDTRTPEKRSEIMAAVRTKHTGPEIAVRRLAFGLGYRFRLHGAKLPGKPDLVFLSRRCAVFVHGCFWHGHECSKGKLPKSRLSYWSPKIVANRQRDERNMRDLRAAGWRILVIWQCELKNSSRLETKLLRFLSAEPASGNNKRAKGNDKQRREAPRSG